MPKPRKEAGPPARGDDSEEVLAAMAAWGEALARARPEEMAALYAIDAVLWGTLSPTLNIGRDSIADYFVNAFETLPGLQVAFHDPQIRLYGDVAVNSGAYTLCFDKEGEWQTLAARYSFTLIRQDGVWLIVDHHSSLLPE